MPKTMEDMKGSAAEIEHRLRERVAEIERNLPHSPWWKNVFGLYDWTDDDWKRWVERMYGRVYGIKEAYLDCASKIIAGEQTAAYLAKLEFDLLKIEFQDQMAAAARYARV